MRRNRFDKHPRIHRMSMEQMMQQTSRAMEEGAATHKRLLEAGFEWDGMDGYYKKTKPCSDCIEAGGVCDLHKDAFMLDPKWEKPK